MANVAQVDMDQVRHAVSHMPGRWELNGSVVVCYSTGSASKRRALTRIGASQYEGEPVLIVDGRDSGQIRDALCARGYKAVAGTVDE